MIDEAIDLPPDQIGSAGHAVADATMVEADVATVQKIDVVPKILEVVCRSTGMGFAAIARVTDSRWICCAVRDEIDFGLKPGGELKVETTLCHEIRQSRDAVVIDDVALDEVYCSHNTPAMYGFQSYISMPIFRVDGSFFGTLCAIDPKPKRLNTPETVGMFKLFAELIAFHLDAADRLASSEASLMDERKTSELREQFIAVLGHDLRNPLTSIAAGARMLRKSNIQKDELQIIDLMQNSVRRMASLIDNVLDFARGRLGGGLALSMALEPLGPVLKQVISELRSAERPIEEAFDLKMPIRCDAVRVAQLLSNLLGNAVAYGSPDKPIRVVARTGLQQLELSVANAGKQISKDALERLFFPFSRGANQSDQQGLGLGLYIASEIARAHGGTLDVSSTGEETKFIFRMPLGT